MQVRRVPCFPLASLLLALGRTHVDYFSLDVEGFEYHILQTVPWGLLNVSTLSVEWIHGHIGKEGYKAYMKERGYKVTADISFPGAKDLIFAKEQMPVT